MIEIDQISKRFLNIQALQDVSLTINRGEVIGLLGPNGAGKSTLFRIVAGLMKPDTGTVRPTHTYWPTTGYKPDRLNFPDHLTVQQYIQMIGRLHNMSKADIRRTVPEIVDQVNLSLATTRKTKQLSKGMRQRLGLAQVMMGSPSLMLLDEPTNGLDPAGQDEILEIINGLKAQGKTILISSHQLSAITAVCDRVVVLSNGTIRFDQPLAEALRSRPKVVITTNRNLTILTERIHQICPTAIIDDTRIILDGVEAIAKRPALLVMLLDGGCDIENMEHKRVTLDEIYVEAVA